jgi:hypothetical protein
MVTAHCPYTAVHFIVQLNIGFLKLIGHPGGHSGVAGKDAPPKKNASPSCSWACANHPAFYSSNLFRRLRLIVQPLPIAVHPPIALAFRLRAARSLIGRSARPVSA